MHIESAARTHVGRRNNNEDSFLSEAALGLFAVADGMGGYEGGEVASKIVVDTLRGFFKRNAKDDDITWPYAIDPALDPTENMLSIGVKLANAEIRHQRTGRLASMGSTVAAILTRGDRVIVGHVGDSRVYRLRDAKLTQLTRDHSLYNEMLEAGMGVGRREDFPHANVITRALGMGHGLKVDVSHDAMVRGDVYMLCTDGLLECVTDTRIAEVLSRESPERAAEILVEEAFVLGGRDNITVVVVRVKG